MESTKKMITLAIAAVFVMGGVAVVAAVPGAQASNEPAQGDAMGFLFTINSKGLEALDELTADLEVDPNLEFSFVIVYLVEVMEANDDGYVVNFAAGIGADSKTSMQEVGIKISTDVSVGFVMQVTMDYGPDGVATGIKVSLDGYVSQKTNMNGERSEIFFGIGVSIEGDLRNEGGWEFKITGVELRGQISFSNNLKNMMNAVDPDYMKNLLNYTIEDGALEGFKLMDNGKINNVFAEIDWSEEPWMELPNFLDHFVSTNASDVFDDADFIIDFINSAIAEADAVIDTQCADCKAGNYFYCIETPECAQPTAIGMMLKTMSENTVLWEMMTENLSVSELSTEEIKSIRGALNDISKPPGSGGDDLLLYIAIAIVAIIVLAAVCFAVVKSRRA